MMFTNWRNLRLSMCLVWFLKVILPVYAQSADQNGTNHDKICETLRDEDGAKLNVLCVGLTKDSLLLVTKDFYVYEVPAESIDQAINTLYLKTKPTPMSEKYPKLWTDSIFEKIKDGLIFNSFVMIDASNSPFLCMTTKDSATQYNGVNYNLATSQIFPGWTFQRSWDEALISTQEEGHFYSISLPRKGETAQMSKYVVVPNKPIGKDTGIDTIDKWKDVCWQNSEQKEITIKQKGEHCQSPEEPVFWSIFRGFVQDKTFYLFGDTGVIIFSEDVYGSGQPYPVTRKTYKSFFLCPGDVPPSDNGSYLWLIILLIIFLLLCLCLILFCVFWLIKRRRKRNKKLDKKGSLSLASIRSQSQGIFGFLTRAPGESSGGKFASGTKTQRTKLSSKSGVGVISSKKSKKSSGKKGKNSRKTGKNSSQARSGRKRKSGRK